MGMNGPPPGGGWRIADIADNRVIAVIGEAWESGDRVIHGEPVQPFV